MTDLPLFPLSAVLFPGGPLALRIFEQRYLDLVRDCARRSTSDSEPSSSQDRQALHLLSKYRIQMRA
jgi:hypothetical protein